MSKQNFCPKRCNYLSILFIFLYLSVITQGPSLLLSSALTFEHQSISTPRGTEIWIKPTMNKLILNDNEQTEGQIIIEVSIIGEDVRSIKNIGLTLDIYQIGTLETESYPEEISTEGSYITQDLTITYDSNWGDCQVRCSLTFTEDIPLWTDEDHESGWIVLFELHPKTTTSTSFEFLIILFALPFIEPIYKRLRKR